MDSDKDNNEEVYFEDYCVKVTPLRFLHRNESLLVEKISDVYVNHKVVRLTAAFAFFLVACLSVFLMGQSAVMLIGIGFIWLYWGYTNYVELWVTYDGKRQKVLHRGIAHSQYVYKVTEALNQAITENKRLRDEGQYEHTDSMRISERMKQYSSDAK